jgi:hypothetical protein
VLAAARAHRSAAWARLPGRGPSMCFTGVHTTASHWFQSPRLVDPAWWPGLHGPQLLLAPTVMLAWCPPASEAQRGRVPAQCVGLHPPMLGGGSQRERGGVQVRTWCMMANARVASGCSTPDPEIRLGRWSFLPNGFSPISSCLDTREDVVSA